MYTNHQCFHSTGTGHRMDDVRDDRWKFYYVSYHRYLPTYDTLLTLLTLTYIIVRTPEIWLL